MKIGNIEFPKHPVFLAPMEDVTDPTFRYMCKQFGVDMMYTEFISAEGLIRGGKKGIRKLDLWEDERPIGIQIYGANIEPMVEAAKIVEKAEPEILDLNFGCPVKKIAGRGAGSGMLREVDKMIEMTQRIVDAVSIPVTAKTRIGWSSEEINIQEVTERIQETGIHALTIHGRTKVQMYQGEADWDVIKAVKDNPKVKIPIIGNGDISSAQDAKKRFEESVMMDRTAPKKHLLSPAQGNRLITLARQTLQQAFLKKATPKSEDPQEVADDIFQKPGGVFVTLKKNGNLRGCIGSLTSKKPLWQGVCENTRNAAFRDPRFEALKASELAEVSIEVSVLTTPISLIYDAKEDLLQRLQPHVDGVILKKGSATATFLPQVWQQLPDPRDFLSHLCLKAGLSANSWEKDKPDISVYQVQAFEESRPAGKGI